MRPPDFELEVYFSRWEFQAPYNLAASDIESMRVADLLDLANPQERALWTELDLSYRPTYGTPELREAIARTYEGIDADDILCFAGAQEGIAITLQTLMDAQGHAVVVTPIYQSLLTIPQSLGATTTVQLRPERNWGLELSELENAFRDNTRLLVMNFPHNPTGVAPDTETFKRIVQLCDANDVWLFSDEVYRGLQLDDRDPLPSAAEISSRGVSLSVMSKVYGMGGLRIGWIACRDRDLLDRLERAKHYASICNSAPSEVLATIALNAGEDITARSRSIVKDNLKSFDEFFAQWPDFFEWTPPRAGCVSFVRYLVGEGTEAMCHELVRSTGVLLLPGTVFETGTNQSLADRFRVGLGRTRTEDALQRWSDWLSRR